MKETTAHYSLDLKIKDTRFSIDYLQDYSLLLQAGDREFQLAVIDTKSNRCLLLEHYNLLNIRSEKDHQLLLEALFEDHHLLMAGFWHSVRFAVKNTRFSLLPAALFDKEELHSYLRLTSPIPENVSIRYYRHLKNSVVTVFGVEQHLLDWLNKRYANLKVQVLPHISSFVEGVLYNPDHSNEQDLFLLLENGVLSVVMTNSGKLEYANVFRCANSSDLLRYLMMIVKQFNLDQATVKVILWGSASADSSWFKEVKPYFGNISFGGRPRFISFNYMFDEVPEHRFFDLFSQYLCE